MTSEKTKLTSRKFYNKWLYKVSLKQTGAAIFRYKDLNFVKDFCHQTENSDRPYSVFYKAFQQKDSILELCEFLEQWDAKLWTKRIENNIIDLYTNDKDFYQQVSLKFAEILIHRFEPSIDNLTLLNNDASVMAVKKLPHNRYRYRVYLLPHKMAGDKEGKQKYINWLKSQNLKVTCTEAVQKWFMHTDWNWDRRYVLVEDEQTLLMMKLRNSEVVGRIYNYVVSDK
jgi:hypothetical protein